MTERHDGYDVVEDGDADAPPITVVTDEMRERMVAAMDEMDQRNAKLLELGFASTGALNDFFPPGPRTELHIPRRRAATRQ